MDQARGRDRRRHDGSHRLRRDALRRTTDHEGLAKAGPSAVSSVQVVLLGTAAGGGFPQWNCWCPTCRVARARARARAVPAPSLRPRSAPTARAGFCSTPRPTCARSWRGCPGRRRRGDRATCRSKASCSPTPSSTTRSGIVLLREARHLQLYATRAVASDARATIRGMLPVTRAFAEVHGRPSSRSAARRRSATATGVPAGSPSTAFPVPGRPAALRRARSAGPHGRTAHAGRAPPAASAPSSRAAAGSTTRCSRAWPAPSWCCSTGPSGPTTS